MILKLLLYASAAVVIAAAGIVLIGYALPQNHVASRDAFVRSPPAQVFARLLDVRQYPAWREDVQRIELVSAEPTQWREHDRGGDVITYEVADSAPPHRLVVRIADPELPFGGTWTYELRPEAAGTRVTITERGEVYNPVFRFMSRFVFGHTATIDRTLGALARTAG